MRAYYAHRLRWLSIAIGPRVTRAVGRDDPFLAQLERNRETGDRACAPETRRRPARELRENEAELLGDGAGHHQCAVIATRGNHGAG